MASSVVSVIIPDAVVEAAALAIVTASGEWDGESWQKRHDSAKGRDLWYCTTDADWDWESYYILEDGNGAMVLWEQPL